MQFFKETIPEWIKTSEMFNQLNEDEEFFIDESRIKSDPSIESYEDYKNFYQTVSFWVLELTPEFYSYSLENKKESLKYFSSLPGDLNAVELAKELKQTPNLNLKYKICKEENPNKFHIYIYVCTEDVIINTLILREYGDNSDGIYGLKIYLIDLIDSIENNKVCVRHNNKFFDYYENQLHISNDTFCRSNMTENFNRFSIYISSFNRQYFINFFKDLLNIYINDNLTDNIEEKTYIYITDDGKLRKVKILEKSYDDNFEVDYENREVVTKQNIKKISLHMYNSFIEIKNECYELYLHSREISDMVEYMNLITSYYLKYFKYLLAFNKFKEILEFNSSDFDEKMMIYLKIINR